MNTAFFERLYQGYAAEHYVAGQLFRRTFEVFRLPADFGLDLVVTNQFHVAKKLTGDAELFPFALQVKSRWLKPEDISDGPNERPEATFVFQLKRTEVNLLSEHANSGMAFVFYWPIEPPTLYEPHMFWLHTRHLEFLVEKGYFRLEEDSYFFSVQYRRRPRFNREGFLAEVRRSHDVPEELAKKIQSLLPKTFKRNWKAADYLRFGRNARDGSNRIVYKTAGSVGMDFNGFPMFQAIDGLD